LLELAALDYEEGELAGAEEALQRVLEVDPESLRAHYQLLRLLERRGDEEAARHEKQVHETLLELYSIQNRTTKSARARRIELKRELLRLLPHPRARVNFVRDLLMGGEYEEARREVLEEGRSRGGYDAELLYLLARSLAGLGNLDGARETAGKMRQVNPNVPDQVLKDILDEWRTAWDVDEAVYRKVLSSWLEG
jgi:Tfp pilus assembly protein PilF